MSEKIYIHPDSTLKEPYDLTNLVEIAETEGNEIWEMHKALDEKNIPYLVEILPYWGGGGAFGRSRYYEAQRTYVEKKHEAEVLAFFEEEENAEVVIIEDFPDGYTLAQIACPTCVREFDMDYPKCPFCKRVVER